MKKIILTSAQDFGYGPLSMLSTVTKNLEKKFSNEYEVWHIANEKTKDFLKSDPTALGKVIIEIDAIASDKNLTPLQSFLLDWNRPLPSAVIGSFDYTIVLWGYMNNIPSFSIDSLLSFWEFPDGIDKLAEIKSYVDKHNLRESFIHANSFFASNKPHYAIASMHSFSDIQLIQRFPGVDERIQILKNLNLLKKSVLTGAFINKKKSQNTIEHSVFVQIGGAKYPILSEEQEVDYLELVVRCITDIAQEFKQISWTILANSDQVNLLHTRGLDIKTSKIHFVSNISPQKVCDYISQSSIIMTPPGLNTIYEAAYYSKPVFLLTEKHSGQTFIHDQLSQQGYNPPNNLIRTITQNTKHLGDEYHETQKMYSLIHTALNNNKIYEKFKYPILNFMQQIINDPEKMQRYSDKNHDQLTTIIQNYNGAEETARVIHNTLAGTV